MLLTFQTFLLITILLMKDLMIRTMVRTMTQQKKRMKMTFMIALQNTEQLKINVKILFCQKFKEDLCGIFSLYKFNILC